MNDQPADESELHKLRKINRVLMDRVERDMDAHGGNAYGLFRTAITLEAQVSARTAELSKLTHQLMHEVAQRREAEKALLAAKAEAEQANLAKTRFLAAATHDLCQPLNAARLFLGALGDEVATDRAYELVGRIDAALDTVDELLSALLDISKLDAGAWPVALTSVAVGPLLERLAEEYRPQATAAGLDLRVVPSRAHVRTDRHLLERVMRNLISNAIFYTAKGRVLIGCRHARDNVTLQVWDTGIGIPEQMRDEIFREFQRLGNAPRRDGKGLGLGLAIVDRISRLLGLDVAVTSTVGRGSCFSVNVARCRQAEASETTERPAAPQPVLTGKCIVVIDNDQAALDATRAVLDGWGCRFVGATSSVDAVTQLATGTSGPDLIIADYHLDDDTRGTDAIETLRARYGHNLPAMVVSGDRSSDLKSALKAAGFVFLAKPASPARLRAMMSYLVSPPTAV